MKTFRHLATALLALQLCAGISFADDAAIPIKEFHTVSDGIYRSGRPTRAGLEAVAALGVKTVINVEVNVEAIEQERIDATQLGLRYFSLPMSAYEPPNEARVNEILAMLDDPSFYPVLIHCKHGQDRTGMLVGIHRVEQQGWSPSSAYREMLSYKFKPHLEHLDGYFKRRVGYEIKLRME